MLRRSNPDLEVYTAARSSARTTFTSGVLGSSTKKDTLLPSAAAIFIRLAIVGVMPLFSILCTAAGERPARQRLWPLGPRQCARCLGGSPQARFVARFLWYTLRPRSEIRSNATEGG